MAKQIISLYIDDNSLRLMVTRGERIKEWAYLPLDRGLVENNLVARQADLASRIKLLFKTLKITKKTVSVGLSGLHCLNRVITLPKLPREMLDEAVRREARRVLPVALEQVYLSWQVVRNTDGQTKIFLVALPTATVDALAGTLRLAGLKSNFLGIKPLLVAGNCGEATAVAIDVQPTEFDITIMVEGIPQAIRTVPFSGDGLSAEAKLNIIGAEVDRIVSFYNTNNPADVLKDEVPVFASGQIGDGIDLCKVLAGATGRHVLPLPAPLDYPDVFDPVMYLANIGLTVNQLRGGRGGGSSLVTLNSLPLNYQTKQVSLINISLIPGAVAAVGVIVFLVFMNQNASAAVSSMSVKAAAVERALQEGLSQKMTLAADIKELENKLQQLTISRNNYQTALVSIEGQRNRTNQDLAAIMNDLPAAIRLSSIKHTGATLEISGIGRAEEDILAYFTQLDSSDLFGEIAITSMSKVKDEGTGFTISVNREKLGDEFSGIKVALRYLPTDVILTSFSQAKDTITLNARAPSEDSIVFFLRKLEESKLFREIALSSKSTNQQGEIEFTVYVKM